MINLDDPKKFRTLTGQAHQVAMNMLRPISRKYDLAEHEYPKELDMLAAMIDGLAESGASEGAGAAGVRRGTEDDDGSSSQTKNGTNLASVMSIQEMCWGDVGLLLSMPRQGLGNSAIASVADDEQLARFDGVWAGMAITEPGTGSDSANIKTTAVLDGDEYVLNGEKIFVTSGDRADHIVVWATLDKELGRAAIKSFVVAKDTPGMRVERLEHKLGIRASDTATIIFDNCRVPKENLLGPAEVDPKQGFAGAMATFDNTRPLVASMAIGCAAAALDLTRELLADAGVEVDYDRPAHVQSAAAAKFLQMESGPRGRPAADAPGALDGGTTGSPTRSRPRWPRRRPAGSGSDVTLSCVELCGAVGYSEGGASCSRSGPVTPKILDIFEDPADPELIVARRVLGLSSTELK